MSSNNTSVSSGSLPCAGSLALTADMFRFTSTRVIYPMYLILCPPAHFLLLVAFYKEWKTESAYMYQVINALLATSETVSHLIHNGIGTFFAGTSIESDGVGWFRGSYSLMYYASRVVLPVHNSLFCACMLFSLAMTVDRIFALWRPFAYQKIKKWRHQTVALILTLLLSACVCWFDAFRYKLIRGTSVYIRALDAAFLSSALASNCSMVRNFVFLVGVVLLLATNLALLKVFQIRNRKSKLLQASHQSANRSSIDLQKKKRDNTLVYLSLAQACSVTIKVTGATVFYFLIYASQMDNCVVVIYSCVLLSTEEIFDTFEAYLSIFVCKKAREMVSKGFRRLWKKSDTAVELM